MYADAMPKQYTMLYNASHLILPFFKTAPDLMKPTSVSSFNPISSIWCVIENMFLAATAEGLACSMRIPVGDEGLKVAKEVGAPDDYLLPCYIGLGYPADDKTVVEQVEYNVDEKMHFGKW
ncbi:nitroreductase family protein [Histomonas meleagridis]|uniref:nitroreductase family protein n=1 Tax=Histomonas meleagridis TaxID=135588 RepID=UPI0035599741|nr:nitroreductase family protein [Histomonas meleagridis]KAH0802801.1 nitroreductase family protein [Histomonas meleagridis]